MAEGVFCLAEVGGRFVLLNVGAVEDGRELGHVELLQLLLRLLVHRWLLHFHQIKLITFLMQRSQSRS